MTSTDTSQTLLGLFVVAVIFVIVHSVIRPVVKLLAFPLYILTFGLFALVTNALMFLLVSWLATQFYVPFTVDGFAAALWGALVTAIVSTIVAAGLYTFTPVKKPSTR